MKADTSAVNLAVTFLRAGKAVVFPTDTAYGLGVDATNAAAVRRLFRIKKRKPTKPVHIVVADLNMAKQYARFSPEAEKLFKKFLPGPLTLILESRISKRKYGRLLDAGSGNIGIRMPKNRISLTLVKKFGKPITATSANLSDNPTTYSVSQIESQYRSAKLKPDCLIDNGKLRRVKPSTMVQLKRNQIVIIRPGPITKNQISNALHIQK